VRPRAVVDGLRDTMKASMRCPHFRHEAPAHHDAPRFRVPNTAGFREVLAEHHCAQSLQDTAEKRGALELRIASPTCVEEDRSTIAHEWATT